MKNYKRGLAWLLALLMMLAAIPFGGIVVAAEEPQDVLVADGEEPETLVTTTNEVLQVGVETMAVIGEEYGVATFTFVPEERGLYRFYSMCDMDVRAYLCWGDGQVITEDDDSGEGANFSLAYQMDAGIHYVYQVSFWGANTGSVPVMLQKLLPTTKGEQLQLDVLTDANVAQSGDEAYFLFTPEEDGYYTITSYSNNGVACRLENEDGYELAYDSWSGTNDNFSLSQQLKAGRTYFYNVFFTNFDDCGTISLKLEKAKEFKTIIVDDFELYAGLDATPILSYEQDESWWWSYPYQPMYTIVWADGATTKRENTSFCAADGYHYVQYYDSQSYHTPWQEGGTYEAAAMVDEKECDTFAITLLENPIASVELSDATYIENTHGYYMSETVYDSQGNAQEIQYYCYDVFNESTDFVVTMKDGTVYNDYQFEWNGHGNGLSLWNQQSARNPYTVGTNAIRAFCAGFDFTYNLHIVENPIVSVEMDPIQKIQGVDSWETTMPLHNEDGDYIGESPAFHFYHMLLPDSDGIIFHLADGTTYVGRNFEYMGQTYYFESTYEQTYETRLLPGSNWLTATVGGFEFTYEVQVWETAIRSVQAAPLQILVNTNGYTTTDPIVDADGNYWGESPWYYYYGLYPEFTITMADGSVVYTDSHYFDWNGNTYSIDIYQDYDSRLLPGMNTVRASTMGCDFTFEVEILETVVASVEVAPIVLKPEDKGGYTSDYCYDENGAYIGRSPGYFNYNVLLDESNCVITLIDGSVYYGPYFEWGYDQYSVEIDQQTYENRLLPGMNTMSATIGGFDFTFEVEIEESIVASVEIPRQYLIVNSSGEWTREEYYDVHGNFQGYSPEYFHYTFGTPMDAVITTKDGEVHYGGSVMVDGYPYWLVQHAAQDYANRLQLGVNVIPVSICGYETTYELEIIENPIVSVMAQPVTVVENYDGVWTVDNLLGEDGWYNTEEYFRYNNADPWKCVVTLQDGTVIHSGDAIYYQGRSYPIEERQNYDHRLLPGSNTVTAVVAGFEFTYVVEVRQSPIAAVEVAPIYVVENQDGFYNQSYMWDENGNFIGMSPEYYYYDNANPSDADMKIILQDGTVHEGSWIQWGNLSLNMTILTEQSYENRLLPGVNVIEATIGGFPFTYTVEVVTEVSNEHFTYYVTEAGAVITDAVDFGEATLVIPDEIDGLPVVGVKYLGWSDAVHSLIFPDSVKYLDSVFSSFTYLEKVQFGSGVCNLRAEWFANNFELAECTVSEENPYYVMVDGSVIEVQTNRVIYDWAKANSPRVIGAEVVCWPAKRYYLMGQELDFSDMIVWVYYSDGTTVTVCGDFTTQGFDNSWPGWCLVYIYYDGYYLCDISVEVVATCNHVYDSDCDAICNLCDEQRETIVEHQYTHDCDPVCLYCGYIREITHVYDDDNDQHCNLCGFFRCIHEYAGDCDRDCDLCGQEREPVQDHTYDDEYDENCNVCGAWRAVPPKPDVCEHEYLEPCGRFCQLCGEERLIDLAHTYDDEYDAECNYCGDHRTVPDKPTVVPGDANGDGKVNNRDLGLLQRHLNEWDVEIDLTASDFNGDGKINNRDLGMLQQHLNG